MQISCAKASIEAQTAETRVLELEKEISHQQKLAEQLAERNRQHEQDLHAEADRRLANFTSDSNKKVDSILSENTSLQSALTSTKYDLARQDQELRSRISELQNGLKSAYTTLHER